MNPPSPNYCWLSADLSLIYHWFIIDLSLIYHWFIIFQLLKRPFLLRQNILPYGSMTSPRRHRHAIRTPACTRPEPVALSGGQRGVLNIGAGVVWTSGFSINGGTPKWWNGWFTTENTIIFLWMISRGAPGTPIYGNHHIVYLCVSPNFMVYNWFIVVYKCLKSIALLELP